MSTQTNQQRQHRKRVMNSRDFPGSHEQEKGPITETRGYLQRPGGFKIEQLDSQITESKMDFVISVVLRTCCSLSHEFS